MTASMSPKIVGGLLVPELVNRVLAGDKDVPGTGADTYGLESGESVRRQASRAWPYLLETWQEYAKRRETHPGSSAQAHRKWLNILLRELGFAGLETAQTVDIDGKSFPISHHYGAHVPVHLLAWEVSLDTRTPNVTARAPHAMVQELLNRSDDRLWALLSNGQVLRVLRDSATLTGQAYFEFDLQAIFGGEQFSDFTRMFLLCHATRFTPATDDGPKSCYLEQWRSLGATQGERALKDLRKGVERAIIELGTGFLTHADNPHLRSRLRNDELSIDDFNRALLRNVYRLLFWFVSEERDVLLQPLPEDDTESAQEIRAARERYTAFFSANRLRKLARKRRGTHHSDLWESTWLILSSLGEEGGIPQLALPGLGGIFETRLPDSDRPLPLDEPLDGARLSNRALLAAVKALAYKQASDGGGTRQVDFGHLGAEELGSIYEGLLELKAHYNEETFEYTLETLAGNERKGSGSYYTPSSLVECLLDSTLDPLLDKACTAKTPQERIDALLKVTVCDPACGSGHFLVAAARRIAKRVAAEETGEPEPTEPAIRVALRKVVGHCIYGVDINPMAAELAKISLWMEALEPGKPLTFLDANIRVGNSLLGATPKLLANGIPSAAFAPIEGDDRKVTSSLKKQNTEEIAKQGSVVATQGIPIANAVFAKRARDIQAVLPDSLEDLHIQQRRKAQDLEQSEELRHQRFLADTWCAAFVQPKTEQTRQTAITEELLEQLAADTDLDDRPIIEQQVRSLSRQYRFFHWHIEYPHLFPVASTNETNPGTGWAGGFSCILGNPPWERVKLQEKEFFAARHQGIATAKNAAARKKLIAGLADSDNPLDRRLDREWRDALRESAGTTHMLRTSGRYPKTGSGDINTYAVFAETSRTVLHPHGRAGLALPTGIATDATTAPFFGDVVKTRSLVSIYDFENEDKLFADVHHSFRFSLFVIAGQLAESRRIDLAFRARQVGQIEEKRFALTPEDIERLNPNTLTCPVFDDPRHAEIVTGIYRRIPVLWRESPESNPWRLSFQAMFHMSNDSGLFHTRDQLAADGWTLTGNIFVRAAKTSAEITDSAEPDGLFDLDLPAQLVLSSARAGSERMLPLYEAKMVHHFDSRFSTYEGATQAQLNVGTLPRLTPQQHADPTALPLPRYWVAESEVEARLQRRNWDRSWLLGWRDICRSSDERTMIATMLPRTATPDGTLLMFPGTGDPRLLEANLSSFVFDYVTRQKSSGTHLKYFTVRQLPTLPPKAYAESVPWLGKTQPVDWIAARVLELSFTARDLADLARDLGDEGGPFIWDDGRRFVMRAELDAAFFHLYGVDRDDVVFILDSFRAFQNNDPERFARTKQLILEIYDAMDKASKTGKPYQTPLEPPPGHGPRHQAGVDE